MPTMVATSIPVKVTVSIAWRLSESAFLWYNAVEPFNNTRRPSLMKKIVFAALSAACAFGGLGFDAPRLKPFPEFAKARALTSGPHDHFLANYFGINPWSPDNRYLLVLETDIKDKLPDGIRIASSSDAGAFYAEKTLAQLKLAGGANRVSRSTDSALSGRGLTAPRCASARIPRRTRRSCRPCAEGRAGRPSTPRRRVRGCARGRARARRPRARRPCP